MNTSRHKFIYRANVLADLAALSFTWLYAAKVAGGYQTGFSLRYMMEMRLSLANIVGAVILATIWILIFRMRGLYGPRRAKFDLGLETLDIAVAAGIGTVVFAALGLFLNISLFSPLFLAVFWAVVTVIEVVFRLGLQWLLGKLHLGDRNQRNILIVGTNETAWDYARKIEANASLGYHLLGFIDDLVVISGAEMKRLGQLRDFSQLLKDHIVDEVAIAMPMHSYSKAIQEIIDQSHERGIAVRFPLSQVFSGMTRNNVWRVRQESTLGPSGEFSSDLVVYSGFELGGRYLVKRAFDVLFAGTLILLTAPLTLGAALLIFLTMGRPVVFTQHRYGYNGRVFNLYKFRTMIKNAEAMQAQLRTMNERDGAAFKMKRDPRVTPLGRFLRKTSIDELPQLINVIKGDMSMVGPRPLPLADYERMDNISHRRRLSVLPGITGTWQISGRDNISFDEWMKMDLDYIDNWRLATDLKIILVTVPIVLFGHGSK